MTKVISYGGYLACQLESCSTFASETNCPNTWCAWDATIVTPAETQPCQDTPDWVNGYGRGCADYASKWCANGGARAGSEWTLGSKYKFPEDNCCVCGKAQASHIGTCQTTTTTTGMSWGLDRIDTENGLDGQYAG